MVLQYGPLQLKQSMTQITGERDILWEKMSTVYPDLNTVPKRGCDTMSGNQGIVRIRELR
jgi:transcriptional regulatory protein LevR